MHTQPFSEEDSQARSSSQRATLTQTRAMLGRNDGKTLAPRAGHWSFWFAKHKVGRSNR